MTILVGDIGKSSVRLQVRDGEGAVLTAADGPASFVLGADGSVTRLLADLDDVLARAGTGARAREVTALGLGVAGYRSHPRLRGPLGAGLEQRFPSTRIAVDSDLITAHAGALRGGPGVCLVAGTGAVALGVGSDGGEHVADGLGPSLGDRGSGAWLGREALAAALRAGQARGGAGPLEAELERALGAPLGDAVRVVHASASPTRRLASLAPAVLAAWEQGDARAGAVVEAGARCLAETVAAAGSALPAGERRVAIVGGLARHDGYRTLVGDAIAERLSGVELVAPAGDALDGAFRLWGVR